MKRPCKCGCGRITGPRAIVLYDTTQGPAEVCGPKCLARYQGEPEKPEQVGE